MVISERLRQLREFRGLSQGDVERRTGMLRCYISRCENGHTSPSLETLEKFARALEVPLYQFFYNGENPPETKDSPVSTGWGSAGHDAKTLDRFRRLLGRIGTADRKLLIYMAQKMSQNRERVGRKKKE
jgi:transcriptional regulator with XRE-family HTH domain